MVRAVVSRLAARRCCKQHGAGAVVSLETRGGGEGTCSKTMLQVVMVRAVVSLESRGESLEARVYV